MAINFKKLATIAFFTPVDGGWGLPLLWTGPPGVAKTALNKAWARSWNAMFLHLSPGQKGDGYFGVVPVPYRNEAGVEVLRFPVNQDIAKLMELGRGLVLADELRSAPGIVRPALLGLAQERMFGDATLPVGVRIWAASNRTAEAVNGRALSAPEANRFCHIQWVGADAMEMMNYGVESSQRPAFEDRIAPDYKDTKAFDDIERMVLADRAQQRGALSTEIFGGFISRYDAAKASALSNQPRPGSPESDGPWPSPRSWTNVLNLQAAYRTLRANGVIQASGHESDDAELTALIKGCVGPIGGEYLEWQREQDIPDYALWLDGKSPVEFEEGRDDRTFLIMAGGASHILSLAKGSPERKRRAAAFWDHTQKLVPTAGFETVMSGAKLLMRAGQESRDLSDMSSKAGQQFMSDYRAITAQVASGGDLS